MDVKCCSMGVVEYTISTTKQGEFINNGIGPSVSKKNIKNLQEITDFVDEQLAELKESEAQNYFKKIVLHFLHPAELGSDEIIMTVDSAYMWNRNKLRYVNDVADTFENILDSNNNVYVCDSSEEMYKRYREESHV